MTLTGALWKPCLKVLIPNPPCIEPMNFVHVQHHLAVIFPLNWADSATLNCVNCYIWWIRQKAWSTWYWIGVWQKLGITDMGEIKRLITSLVPFALFPNSFYSPALHMLSSNCFMQDFYFEDLFVTKGPVLGFMHIEKK